MALTLPTPVTSLTPMRRSSAGGTGGGALRMAALNPVPVSSSPEEWRFRRCGDDVRFSFWAALPTERKSMLARQRNLISANVSALTRNRTMVCEFQHLWNPYTSTDNQSVLRAEKKFYKTLTRLVTHGAESWTLNKDTAKRLADFERKVFRIMFRGVKVNENWRKRCNRELVQLFGDLDILSFVRISRLN